MVRSIRPTCGCLQYISTIPPTRGYRQRLGRPSGDTCSVGLELSPGQSCSVDISIEGQGYHIRYYRFKVKADEKGYYNRFERQVLPGLGYGQSQRMSSSDSAESIDIQGFQASRIADTSRWKIKALP